MRLPGTRVGGLRPVTRQKFPMHVNLHCRFLKLSSCGWISWESTSGLTSRAR